MVSQISEAIFFMEYKFSEKLRGKLIDYFLRKHKVDVSQEQADEYLHSMAGLYSTFKKRNGKENFCSPPGEEKVSLRSST